MFGCLVSVILYFSAMECHHVNCLSHVSISRNRLCVMPDMSSWFGDIAKFYNAYINVLLTYSNILLFTANAFWMGTFCKWPPTCPPFSRNECGYVSQLSAQLIFFFQANENSQYWRNTCRSWQVWKQILWETTWHSVWWVNFVLLVDVPWLFLLWNYYVTRM